MSMKVAHFEKVERQSSL